MGTPGFRGERYHLHTVPHQTAGFNDGEPQGRWHLWSKEMPFSINGALIWVIFKCPLHYLCTQCCVSRWCTKMITSPLLHTWYKCFSNEESHINEPYLGEARAKKVRKVTSAGMKVQMMMEAGEFRAIFPSVTWEERGVYHTWNPDPGSSHHCFGDSRYCW